LSSDEEEGCLKWGIVSPFYNKSAKGQVGREEKEQGERVVRRTTQDISTPKGKEKSQGTHFLRSFPGDI